MLNTNLISDGNDMSNESPEVIGQKIAETQQRLLHIAASQIKEAVRESDGEVEALAQAMRAIAVYSHEPKKDSNVTVAPPDNLVVSSCPKDVANECMILLQFHDRMSQRLEHAANMVRLLADSFQARDGLDNEMSSIGEWERVTEDLRNCYTSERERRLFDAIMEQGPDSSAVDEATSYSQDVAKSERIELF